MNTTTIAQARQTVLANLSEFHKFGPLTFDGQKTPHYGLFREDTGECVGPSVKAGFVAHTVEQIADLTEAAIMSFDSAHDARVTCYMSDKGHSVIVAPSDDYRRSIYGSKDNLFPRLKIDAFLGRAFCHEIGMYRDACKNLSIPRQVSGGASRFRHTASLRTNLDSLVEDCRRSVERFESIAAMAERMEARRVNVADFIAELYPEPETDSKKARTQAKRRAEKILSRMLRERDIVGRPDSGNDPREATLWECLNAVTGYVQHDKTRHKVKGREMGVLDRAIAGVDDAETVRAWDLAVTMAG